NSEGVEQLSRQQMKGVDGGRRCEMVPNSQQDVISAGEVVAVVCTWNCRRTFLGFEVGSEFQVQGGCGMFGTH
ncbi:MAG: hypothetical protein ACOVLC_11990, partial [Flavobacterium sp.]